jgi:hypothetical protein
VSASSDRYFGRIRETVLAALDGIDATVYLYGAHARGAGRWSNEIELAIEATAPLPPDLLASIYKQLERSTGSYNVDITEMAKATPARRRMIRREGLVWRRPDGA